MMRSIRYVPVVVCVAVAAVLVAADKPPKPKMLGQGVRHVNTVTVRMKDDEFDPRDVTISAGDSVTWVNVGNHTHTATSDDGTSFDTGDIDPGQSITLTFSTAGTFPYHCVHHDMMKGTLTVR